VIRSILHLLAQPYVQFATFSGRARRAEFWLFVLSLLIIVNVTSAVMEAVLRHGHGPYRFAFIEHGMRDGGAPYFNLMVTLMVALNLTTSQMMAIDGATIIISIIIPTIIMMMIRLCWIAGRMA
jgi:uncharacterized membrane protein YhaH (DUF805 family)